MEALIKNIDRSNYDPEVYAMFDPDRFDPDNLFGHRKADRKAKRQDAKIARRASRTEAKNQRRATRTEGKQERKMVKAKSAAEHVAAQDKAIATVNAIAAEENLTPEQVSQQIAENKQDAVTTFIQSQGQVPVSYNPTTQAAQAAMIHEGNIQAYQEEYGVPDYDVAETAVYQDYIEGDEQNEWYEDEADSFALGAILGSIFNVAKSTIEKINTKRVANGKKPIFAGAKWKALQTKIANKVDIQGTDAGVQVLIKETKAAGASDPSAKADLQILLDAAMKEAERVKKQEFLNKNLPLIIIGVVVLFFVAKKI